MLPIDAELAAIVAAVTSQGSEGLILRAAPGTGKTTRVPPALAKVLGGLVVVLEPRRLAARSAAARVAEEEGWVLGQEVGFAMRHERAFGANTQILYMTEGMFAFFYADEPWRRSLKAVVFDEFHERHSEGDYAFALCRASRDQGLRIVLMSATLDDADLLLKLPDFTVLDVPGIRYSVAIEYFPRSNSDLLIRSVETAVRKMLEDSRCPGDILVFVNGIAEIRTLASLNWSEVQVLPLAGELAMSEQQRVFTPSTKRRIIFATNIAETSITIPGVTGVIDCGTAKGPRFNPLSGLTRLEVQRVSASSCVQRQGRAGRIGPGVCYRLYSEQDFLGRPGSFPPEILRLNFSRLMLTILNSGKDPENLPWVDPPTPEALADARLELELLALVDETGVTALGREAAKLPLDPRVALVCLAGDKDNLPWAALTSAILDSEAGTGQSWNLLDVILGSSQTRLDRLPPEWLRNFKQIMRLTGNPSEPEILLKTKPDMDDIKERLLRAFNDRVAMRQSGARVRDASYHLCMGRDAKLSISENEEAPQWLLVLDAIEHEKRGKIYLGMPIIESDFARSEFRLYRKERELIWDDKKQGPIAAMRSYYGKIRLGITPLPRDENDAAALSAMLEAKLLADWPAAFGSQTPIDIYHHRIKIAEQAGGTPLPLMLSGEVLRILVATMCDGATNLREITAKPLSSWIDEQLSFMEAQTLATFAPLEFKLPRGRMIPIHYEDLHAPWIEGRVQDFFGLKVHPTVGRGQVVLVVKLLAPNGRPVQVTGDLVQFWRTSYPEVRRVMAGRYPKHAWPIDPTAETEKST